MGFDVGWIAIIISVITTVFLIWNFKLNKDALDSNKDALKENSNMLYAQLLGDYDEDFKRILAISTELKSAEQCRRFGTDYINILERLARLDLENKIPSEIAIHFTNYFGYGITIKELFKKNNIDIRDDKFSEWCIEHKIDALPEENLPFGLRKIGEFLDKEHES